MNHWRNEALSKIFFFLIAGPRLIRLKDKGKLIKYVNIWSLFVSLWSKFWNAAIWLDCPLCGSLDKRERRRERADDLAVWVHDWPLSISGSPEAAVVRGAHAGIRRTPSNGARVIPLMSWPGSFHRVGNKTLGFADSTCMVHFPNMPPFNLGSLQSVPLSHLCLPCHPVTQVAEVSRKWEENEKKLGGIGDPKRHHWF